MVRQPVGSIRDEWCPHAECEFDRIDRIEIGARRLGVRFMSLARCRRSLVLGQRVDLIVIHDECTVKILFDPVDQMIAADTHRVAVAGMDKKIELRPR